MTRWQANTGRGEKVEERKNRPDGAEGGASPAPLGGVSAGGRRSSPMERLGLRFDLSGLETEDLLLALILYLLYRESGDRDFLILLAGTIFG